MNSLDSTNGSIENISKLLDEDSNCTAIDNTTRELCGETETLKIIDQFQKLYETRIENVDREIESEYDQVCTKLEISNEWIRNLREQNIMLVQVVEDLERAACNKVKLLEQKLKHSSTLVSENITSSVHTGKTINTLSSRVSDLEKGEEYMRQKIEFLQSDIRGLLELIRRAVQEKHWSLEDIKFFEIQPTDIPVPNDCICDQENHKKVQSLKLQIKDLQESERRMIEYKQKLEDKVTQLNSKLQSKEDTIKSYVSQFQNFNDSIRKRAKFAEQDECNNSLVTNCQETCDIILVAGIVENLFIEKDLETINLQERLQYVESNLAILTCDSDRNINNLKMQLNEKCKIIEEVEQQMSNLQKDSVEKQGHLTAEVMGKNEIVMSLQKQTATLQEQCRYANIQIRFKEDVIKEMRKKLKQAIAKFQCLYPRFSSRAHNCYSNVTIDNQEMEFFCKLCEDVVASEIFYTPAEHTNDLSFLQRNLGNTINHNKLIENIPKIKTKDSNLTTETINYCESTNYNNVNMHKRLQNLDKKILKHTKKLPTLKKGKQFLPSKETCALGKSETCDMQNVCVNITFQEEVRNLRSPTNEQNEIVSYLNKVKLLMEQESEDLYKLKMELEKTIEKLCYEKNAGCCVNGDESNEDNVGYELTENIEYINKMISKNEESRTIINSLLQMENNKSSYIENFNLIPCTDIGQQFKLMDIFKTCAVEAQATMDDIKDEMNTIVFSFKCRHQKYTDLNKEVTNVQNQLLKSREKIAGAINRLQLREEEGMRQNERITLGKIKLKDIKNKINHTQCRLSARITETQNSAQENILFGYTEICDSNDLLCSLIDEVEKTSCCLQIFQEQGCSITTELETLNDQLCEVDSSIRKLQEKIDEALSDHDMVETILLQKEQKLQKLEGDVDMTHVKIQNIVGTFFSSNEQVSDCNITEAQLYMQTLNEILQVKQDVYKLRKEHDDVKCNISQKSLYTECDKRTCLWKSRVSDLQDQVKILQHEAKCNEEANNFLRNNLGSIEQELHVVQAKADHYRRSHFIDNMELKKKIIELENTLKFQREIECTLRRQLSDNEVELKRSKDLSNSCNLEHSLEEALLRCGCNQFRHDTMTVPQLFKTLENTIRSTKTGLQELRAEFKNMICEDDANFRSSTKSFLNLMENLQRYEDEIDNCFQEIEELKNALYSKDKLIENMDEIIKIQKDSILMTQAELKELHQKLQEKIDDQDRIISQYEKEKKELSSQNELQVQTIGHLQNAVVEAKRCIDQMGHRTESNQIASKLQLEEKTEAIRLLTVYVEETQSQYNECFTEAAKQDKCLELQRDAIRELQQKICCMEYDHRLTIMFVHITYYSILKAIQEQVGTRVYDIQALKNKMDILIQSKCHIENKYLHVKKLWQEAEEKLQELRKETLKSEYKAKVYDNKECQCKIEVKDCSTQDIFDSNDPTCNNREYTNLLCKYDMQSEIEILTRENEDMKNQLQKYKLDFDIIDKELKVGRENDTYTQQISLELQKLRDTECCLQYENEQLKTDLNKQTQRVDDLLEKLQFTEKNDAKLEKLLKKLEDKQIQINGLCNQITNSETVMKKQIEIIDDLENKLNMKNKQVKEYLSELDDAEEEMSTLHERIKSLKVLLKTKSDDMAKLQADYEVLKNDNSILKMESNTLEDRTKEDICHLQMKLKEVQRQLYSTETNYYRVTDDFNKTQEQLITMSKREADLQECLTNVEKDYCLKLSRVENEKVKLEGCLDKLRNELLEIQRNYTSKNGEHCKLQDICKSYAEQLELLQQQVENERGKVKKMEESNCCIVKQLQECMGQNCALVKEKAVAQQNNCEIISELQETHKSLLELKRKCQLKNKSLACISAELTETAMSRSELCNQSQYVVSCIRIWMEEQREYVNKLSSKLKSQQQELVQLGFEKKTMLDEMKKLRRVNHSLMQRIKRIHRHGSRNVRNVCVGCQILPQNIDIRFPTNSKYTSQKKLNLMKTARRISVCGSAWWFPRMKYLVNELRKSNVECSENCFNGVNTNIGLKENHDCGYQSSTSK